MLMCQHGGWRNASVECWGQDRGEEVGEGVLEFHGELGAMDKA